jgi:predicted ATP-dependent endonuclease of OLD family
MGDKVFSELKVNDFRALKDKTFRLGKYITMLAGWNATGKSTLLALLANASELKPEEGKTYNDRLFRADFSEILKGSVSYDKSKSNRAELIWSDGGKDITKTFRTAWQNAKTRFRVIPQGKDDKEDKITAQKFPFPVLYLGLSRLYPLGETDDAQIKSENQLFRNDQDKEWFIDSHKRILSINDAINDITNIDFKSAKKNTSGINADNYDWKTNSSGQDNLSQILFAVLSFKNLKREKGDDFKGGLLIIDEIEASLHPKAQEKVIDFLIKEAKSTGFQVIFATHSLTIIEKLSQKTQERNNDNNISSYYFTKANGQLEILKNAKFDDIRDDLLVALYKENTVVRIIVYTEDNEARWFLKKLLTGWLLKIQILNINISCHSLIDLINVEPAFANHLVVFDGDLKATDIRRIKKNTHNFILLPVKNNAKHSPEKVFRDFLFSNTANTYYAEQHTIISQVKKEYFEENDVEPEGAKAERERYKTWFKQHKTLFDKSKIFNYWKKENQDLVNAFRDDFKEKFNRIADKMCIPKIA